MPYPRTPVAAPPARRPMPYPRPARRQVAKDPWLYLVLGCVVAMVVLVAVLVRSRNVIQHDQPSAVLLFATTTPLWLIAVAALHRLRPGRRAVWALVLGASAALLIVAMTAPPATSNDDFRYAWDAKVQLAGIDPYRYAPIAPQLNFLRDGFVFGEDPCVRRIATGCTALNRPSVNTIYPPVAQAAFVLIRLTSFGGSGNHLPLQMFAALGVLAVAALLLRRYPQRPWAAALWAWSPLAVLEYGNNAHIDWLAVLLVVLALGVRSTGLAGVLVGAAIAVKIYPVLVLPALMRRSWLAAVAAVGVVVVGYVPHVVAVGSAVIGYLPGYLKEEDYASGSRLQLLGVLPHPADVVVGVLVVGTVALWAWLRGTERPESSAVIVMGVALLAFTPSYGWYAGVLLALVAMSGALRWLPVALAPIVAYLTDVGSAAYAVAAGLVLASALWSRYPRGALISSRNQPASST